MSSQDKTKEGTQHSADVLEAANILLALKEEDRKRMEAAKALLDLRYGPIDEGEETEIEDWEHDLKPTKTKK